MIKNLSQKILLLIIVCSLLFSQAYSITQQNTESQVQSKHSSLINLTRAKNYYPFPKIIWLYWDKLQTLTSLQKIFINKFKEIIKKQQNQQWKLQIVTNQNVVSYFQNKTQVVNIMFQLPYSPQQKSDYIRLSLLQQHGGVYFDLTTIIHNDLKWLTLEQLWNSPIIQNRHPILSSQPDVLLTYWGRHGFKYVYLNQFGQKSNNFPGYQSYFIAAKPKVKLITDWKNQLILFLSLDCSSIFEKFRLEDSYIGDFWYDCYFKVYFSLYGLLSRKQKQIDQTYAGQGRLTSQYYYNIWTFQSSNGPGISLKGDFYSNFFQLSIQELQAKLGVKEIYYFTKLTSIGTNLFNDYRKIFRQQGQQRYMSLSLLSLYEEKVNKRSEYKQKGCKQYKYLNKQSLINRYLNKQLMQFDTDIKSYQNQQCIEFNKYCSKQMFVNRRINKQRQRSTKIKRLVSESNIKMFKVLIVIAIITFFIVGVFIIWRYVQNKNKKENNKMDKKQDMIILKINNIISLVGLQVVVNSNQLTKQKRQSLRVVNMNDEQMTMINSEQTEVNYLQQQTQQQNSKQSNLQKRQNKHTTKKSNKQSFILYSKIIYFIIQLIQIIVLFLYSENIQWSNQKQQYISISLVMIGMIIIQIVKQKYRCLDDKKQLQFPYEKQNDSINYCWFSFVLNRIFNTLYLIMMIKLFLQMIYFQPQYIQLKSLQLAILLTLMRELIKDKHNKDDIFTKRLSQYHIYQVCQRNTLVIHNIIPLIVLAIVLYFQQYSYNHYFCQQLMKATLNITQLSINLISIFVVIYQIIKLLYIDCNKQLNKKQYNSQQQVKYIIKQKLNNSSIIIITYMAIFLIHSIYDQLWIVFWKDKSSFHSLYLFFIFVVTLISLIAINKNSSLVYKFVSALIITIIYIKFYISFYSIPENDIEIKYQSFQNQFKPFIFTITKGIILFLVFICLLKFISSKGFKITRKQH